MGYLPAPRRTLVGCSDDARQSYCTLVHQPSEARCWRPRCKVLDSQVLPLADMKTLLVAVLERHHSSTADSSPPSTAQRWRSDDAGNRDVVFSQGNERRPLGTTTDECNRAIDAVDEPRAPRRPGDDSDFLALEDPRAGDIWVGFRAESERYPTQMQIAQVREAASSTDPGSSAMMTAWSRSRSSSPITSAPRSASATCS